MPVLIPCDSGEIAILDSADGLRLRIEPLAPPANGYAVVLAFPNNQGNLMITSGDHDTCSLRMRKIANALGGIVNWMTASSS